LQLMKSTETIYFWRCMLSNGITGAITSTRITMRFSIIFSFNLKRCWPKLVSISRPTSPSVRLPCIIYLCMEWFQFNCHFQHKILIATEFWKFTLLSKKMPFCRVILILICFVELCLVLCKDIKWDAQNWQNSAYITAPSVYDIYAVILFYCYAQRRYSGCRYGECRGALLTQTIQTEGTQWILRILKYDSTKVGENFPHRCIFNENMKNF